MPSPRATFLWARRSWRSDLLLPLAWLFGALTALRRSLYRHGAFKSARLAAPTIVVGNIAVGGTGKTPFVIALVQALKAQGLQPGVISRGYGGRYSQNGLTWSEVKSADAGLYGDEIVLVSERTGVPCVVAAKRLAAGRELIAAHPEINVVVADDGLQHYALAREVEIVMFDSRGVGNGRLLPAGPLREPVERLAEVSAVVVNGEGSVRGCAMAPSVPVFRMLLESGDAYVLAVAGIGNPERFFSMLRNVGLNPQTMALPDHFSFAPDFFASLTQKVILITEKDAVKCRQAQDPRVWVVPVTGQIEPALLNLILEKLRAPR
jgi:tetraacyldisaccharide 4'-kinase